MAYTGNTLVSVVASPDGSTPALWIYTSTDDAATVAASGYFANASSVGLKVGDLVIVQETDNSRAPTLHVVASLSSGAATVPKAEAIPGLTATATELNTLDGITATTAELNKLSGAGATVASGTQLAKIADASTAHALNATFSDTEVEAALNALGTKVNTIIDALEAYGISASA